MLYVEPDSVVPRVTWPLYSLLPMPVLIPWYSKSLAPVFASVMTCNWLGVPSSCRPPTTDSQASTGAPEAAQTTLREVSTAGLVAPSAFARPIAKLSADAADRVAVVLGTLMVALVALSAPFEVPSAAVCTTRSPPRTGRPANVRS